MSTSAVNFQIPPEVSGALRYERVAQLEAVLTLREKNQRTRFWRSIVLGVIFVPCLVIAGALLARLVTG
jgi:hypothetical protein